VDHLIGKYALLPIDRVLAISRTGFSGAAKLKAELHGIELVSPEEIASANWPSRFQKVGIASLVSRLDMEHIEFYTTPPFTGTVSLDDRIRHDAGGERDAEGTVREFIEAVRPTAIATVRKYLSEKFLTIYKTLADLKKTAILDSSMSATGLTLLVGNSRYKIEKLSFRIIAHNDRTIVPVEHRRLGSEALLSSGRVGDLDLVIAQAAGASQGKVFLQPVPRKSGASAKRSDPLRAGGSQLVQFVLARFCQDMGEVIHERYQARRSFHITLFI